MSEGSDRNDRHSRSSRERSGQSRESGDFQQAVDRLEKAVQDLVGSATNEFSDRATTFLNETTAKLEMEFSGRRSGRAESRSERAESRRDSPEEDSDRSSAAARMEARRNARRQSRRIPERTRRLYRDPKNEKIAGVCAGIANYYGMETWVVRCVAVTGLLFLPSIVFPAYWIAYFVMDTPPKENSRKARKARKARNGSDHSSPAPELGAKISPRRSLRGVQADLSEVELRLRRMESHVTSGQYELQRELNKIDQPSLTPSSGGVQ